MAGPWEEYQDANTTGGAPPVAAGPWSEYATPEAAPELDAGRVGGLILRAGVQAAPLANPAVSLPALAVDAVRGGANIVYRGIDALAGTDLASAQEAWGGPMAVTGRIAKMGEDAADAAGLPVPVSSGEKIAVTGAQTGIEALTGAGAARLAARATTGRTATIADDLAAAPVTQAGVGAAVGGGVQTAVENDVNPLIGGAAGMLLGVGTIGGKQLAQRGFQKAREGVDATLLRTPEAQQAAADAKFRGAATNPETAAQAIDNGGAAELVPGSKPTTFQSTGDMGLGDLERGAQTANPGAFADRRAAQNSARLAAVEGVQGEGVSTDIVQFLRNQLRDIDDTTATAERSAQSQARGAGAAIMPADDAAGVGRSIRDPMTDAETGARGRERALWEAIDPDGNVQAITPKREFGEVYSEMTRSARLGISDAERQIVDLVDDLDNTVAFRELTDLRQQITQAMREELTVRGRTQSYRRLTQLNNAVSRNIESTAFNELSANPGRFQAFRDEWDQATGEGTGSRDSGSSAVQARAISGVAREAAPVGGGSGAPARVAGVSGGKKQRRPLSLTEYIARNGGLPLDAESTARDWGNVTIKGFGKLARANGRPIDGYWRTKLMEAGYLPHDADGYTTRDVTKELYDLIEQERAGRKTLTADDQMNGRPAALDDESAEMAEADKLIREVAADVGVRPADMKPEIMAEAVELYTRGGVSDPLIAYEEAVMKVGREARDPEVIAAREVDPAPEPVPEAPAAPSSGKNIFDLFSDDTEVGKRYRAAADATKQRAGTFGSGPAGAVLRKGGDSRSFRMSDASVAANAFRPGPTGAERIRSLVAAGASPESIGEAAALTLGKHMRDGVLDARGFEQWSRQYREALAELPETVRAQFRDAAAAGEALEIASAARRDALQAFERSTLGRVAGVDTGDLPNVIRGILNSADAGRRTSELVRATAGDATARAALKRAYAEHIQRQFVSNKEVGTSGENALKADQFASFVKDKRQALAQVFSGPELANLQAIVDDIRRAERSLYAVRTPGQSNTAQDIGGALDRAAKKASETTLLSQVLGAGAVGGFFGNIPGAVASAGSVLGARFLGSIRAAGIQKVDDLVLEMILDPALGRIALTKGPARADKGAQVPFAQRMLKTAPFAAVAGADAGSE